MAMPVLWYKFQAQALKVELCHELNQHKAEIIAECKFNPAGHVLSPEL